MNFADFLAPRSLEASILLSKHINIHLLMKCNYKYKSRV